LVGGIAGLFIFLKWLNFDDAIVVLSVVWGGGMISLLLIDILDIFLISFAGSVDVILNGILDLTLLIQMLLWIGMALLGIFMQRRLGFQPILFDRYIWQKNNRFLANPVCLYRDRLRF
jgi:hypothetical protein